MGRGWWVRELILTGVLYSLYLGSCYLPIVWPIKAGQGVNMTGFLPHSPWGLSGYCFHQWYLDGWVGVCREKVCPGCISKRCSLGGIGVQLSNSNSTFIAPKDILKVHYTKKHCSIARDIARVNTTERAREKWKIGVDMHFQRGKTSALT